MKREDAEAGSAENLVRYRKEPSGCPVCGKVTQAGAGARTQLTFSNGKAQSSMHCVWRGRGNVKIEWVLGVPSRGVPSLGALVISLAVEEGAQPCLPSATIFH